MNSEESLEQGPNHLVEVWKKVIDLQMHFNEMCMNLRRIAISVLGVLLAAGAIAFRFGGLVEIYEQHVSVAFVFVAIGLLVWFSFFSWIAFGTTNYYGLR